MDPPAGQRPEPRSMVVVDVDRAAPGVLDPDVGEAREPATQALRGAPGAARVMRERPPDPTAEPGPPSAAAEGDPAVGRRPRVVEREPRVGDALAAGPADLGQAVRDRFGQDDVARPRDEPAAERGPCGGPGVEGHDDLVGDDQARRLRREVAIDGRRLARRRRGSDARPLVDDDAALQGDAAKPAGEGGRLDGRRARHERARRGTRASGPGRRPLAVERPPAIRLTRAARRPRPPRPTRRPGPAPR